MKKNTYVVVSKDNGKLGRNVLVSFAAKPMWHDYEQLRRYEHTIPDYYDRSTAEYALKKYADSKDFEVLPAPDIQKELSKYIKDNPNWQA